MASKRIARFIIDNTESFDDHMNEKMVSEQIDTFIENYMDRFISDVSDVTRIIRNDRLYMALMVTYEKDIAKANPSLYSAILELESIIKWHIKIIGSDERSTFRTVSTLNRSIVSYVITTVVRRAWAKFIRENGWEKVKTHSSLFFESAASKQARFGTPNVK